MGRFIFVSFSLLVGFLSLSGTAADCPSDWSTHGQYCYKLFQQKMNWADAERFCSEQAKGGHLVFIQNSGEGEFVSKLITENIQRGNLYAWIGLRIQNKEKQCSSKWSDGSSLSYENLVGRSVKKCFAMHKPFGFTGWVNIYCGKTNPFVCKSPPP